MKILTHSIILHALLIQLGRTNAATVNAASCNQTDVQAAVNLAVNGDSVVIPACSQTNWTTTLMVNAGITLQGAGIDATTIGDNVPKSAYGPGTHLMVWNVNAPNTFRMTGMTIVGVAAEPPGYNIGHLTFFGSAKQFRIDHLKFTNMTTAGMWISGDTYGLVDHISMTKQAKNGIVVDHSEWEGGTYGNKSWSQPIYWGTDKYVFVEDSVFEDKNISQSGAINDCEGGGRIVFRHNTIKSDYIQAHGTDSSQARRSCRVIEIYANQYINGSAASDSLYSRFTASYIRGGTAVVYDNDYDQTSDWDANFPNLRDLSGYAPWGQCDGTSVYDQNQSGQTGYLCADQPGTGTSNALMVDSSGTPQPLGWVGNTSDPIYIWGNRKGGAAYTPRVAGTAHTVAGRDWIFSPRAGYTALQYPHPLQNSSSLSPARPLGLALR